MARQQRSKAAAGRPRWRETRDTREYVARVITTGVRCDVVARHGPGDRVAAWVAGQQLGLITAAQLHAAGLDKDAIRTRTRRAELRQLHRGVYAHGADQVHIAAGHRVIRVTWRQLDEEAVAVIATIAGALRACE